MAKLNDEHLGELISVDEVAELLGVPTTRIKQLERDNFLVQVRRGKLNYVPGKLLVPIPLWQRKVVVPSEESEATEVVLPPATYRLIDNLRGTLTLLEDAGFSTDEAIAWLWAPEDELEQSPLDAIIGGHHHHVNRIAGALGF